MMAAGALLSHLANVGQFVEIGQGHAYQREQIRWTRRAYMLDTQALRLDLLGNAKDEIRAHYDTYVSRTDTLLLVDALLWNFALASLQFAEEFVPQKKGDCDYCIEASHPWLIKLWVVLVGLTLVLPFWSILMLIRCKSKLDNWLEVSLASLNRERRMTVTGVEHAGRSEQEQQAKAQLEIEEVINRLGGFIIRYQDHFSQIWNVECGKLYGAATTLLWLSAVNAISLVSFMFWFYVVNWQANPWKVHYHFVFVMGMGMILPAAYVLWSRRRIVEPDIDLVMPSLDEPKASRQPFPDPRRQDLQQRTAREPLLAD